MNPSRTTFNPAADEQASLWAARLDGSVLSAEDRIALDAWLAAAPAHRELLSQYCQFAADLEQKLPALVTAGAVDLPPATNRRAAHWGLWTAGVSLAAAALAVLLWPARPQSQFENRATTVAQRQTLVLADGSQVDLNAQTNLQVEVNGRIRHVLLASGEAFFVVHKDPSRPFIVETPAGSVRVTGTQFNVRTDSTSTFEVTVLEGSVQTHPAALNGSAVVPQPLTAGDQLTASRAGVEVHRLSADALDRALAWRQGKVVFVGEPLSSAAARFARYHGRGILVDPAVAQLKVGGRYGLDDLDGFLRFIEDELPVQVVHESNGTVRVGPRAAR